MKYLPVIIAVVAALFLRIYIISVFKVPGQSMAPTLLAGDYILAIQSHAAPALGELIVFSKNSRAFIKRVVAVENQEVEYKNGELYINDQKCTYQSLQETDDKSFSVMDETCEGLSRKILRPQDLAKNSVSMAKTKLLPGDFLVIGDNRSFENNLTNAEILHSDQILGKPLVIWMSYASTQDFISKTLGFRWNRILTIL